MKTKRIERSTKPAARLFSEPEPREDRFHGAYTANIDGAARGNPGPASYAVVLCRPDGTPLESLGRYIGRQTNNVAEYYALIAALDYALAHNVRRLRIRSDSELLVRQVQGVYKVKSPDLRPLYERARKMIAGLEAFAIEHVPREQNADADAAANAVLDNTGGARNAVQRSEDRTFRAEYRGGVLHPLAPLDLREGAAVRLRIVSGEER
jgi:probable phosphoglycerate mutase